MKIIFFGTPSFVDPIFEELKKHFDVILGNNLSIEQLRESQPDLFVVAAFGKILPKEMLDIPRLGSINVHPSLLPKYRGPSPLQTTILNGDTETGISLIQMDEEVDHGPLLYQKKVVLQGNETFESLAADLFKRSAEILPDVIKQYVENPHMVTEQHHEDATFTEHVTRENGKISLDNPPSKTDLERMIRAYHPWPGVWFMTTINNKEVRVKLLPEEMIQVEGKKPMNYKDFINGYPNLSEIILPILQISNSK